MNEEELKQKRKLKVMERIEHEETSGLDSKLNIFELKRLENEKIEAKKKFFVGSTAFCFILGLFFAQLNILLPDCTSLSNSDSFSGLNLFNLVFTYEIIVSSFYFYSWYRFKVNVNQGGTQSGMKMEKYMELMETVITIKDIFGKIFDDCCCSIVTFLICINAFEYLK